MRRIVTSTKESTETESGRLVDIYQQLTSAVIGYTTARRCSYANLSGDTQLARSSSSVSGFRHCQLHELLLTSRTIEDDFIRSAVPDTFSYSASRRICSNSAEHVSFSLARVLPSYLLSTFHHPCLRPRLLFMKWISYIIDILTTSYRTLQDLIELLSVFIHFHFLGLSCYRH